MKLAQFQKTVQLKDASHLARLLQGCTCCEHSLIRLEETAVKVWLKDSGDYIYWYPGQTAYLFGFGSEPFMQFF